MSEQVLEQIREIDIGSEMRNSFMDYAMSVIVSRALPDVRDGLKPVHRRILFAMSELGMSPDKPYKKSARIVGEVIGKYHPHGDSAVYETMVRMAQDFSYRYMLVDGHGNFGSVDGDAAAAMRYTEAKLSKISMELLRDIGKDTIDFIPNYDGEEHEPTVMPSRFPHLLVNGSSGIAVGMATNIPPHHLGEVIDGVIRMIDQPDVTSAELMQIIKGPDFPTGGIIMGSSGIRSAYMTGRGSVVVRAVAEMEEENNRTKIIVTELPYQVNKARLIEKIAELVREKKLEGITDLRDESDRNGMRIVIELRRDVTPSVVLNNLYKQTQMQTSFGIIMLALVNGEPRVLTLSDVLKYYLQHQQVVIRRRTEFELRKAQARAHILEGLRIALDHLDAVIALIRASQTTEEARNGLITQFQLTEIQAQAILEMRLQRLTGLEREKIENEYRELMTLINYLQGLLADESKILEVIRTELLEIKDKFADERRTEIGLSDDLIEDEDLIPVENVVVTITHTGYVKRMPVTTYRSQRRGGKGMIGMDMKDNDYVEHLITTSTHNYLLMFTNKGKAYRLKAYEIPDLGRTARGTPIINLLQIEQGEKIRAVIPVPNMEEGKFLFFATKKGIVKRTELSEYSNIRRSGLIAINLREDDDLIKVLQTEGQHEVIMGTRLGMSIRFEETDARDMGRGATGVKGIDLDDEDEVIDVDVVSPDDDVLIVTEKGYGKRTPVSEYRVQTRGGKGVKTIQVTSKNGSLAGLKLVNEDHDLIIITTDGQVIRTPIEHISQVGRNTQGVRLINLRDEDAVSTVTLVMREEDEEEELEALENVEGEEVVIEVVDRPEGTEE